MLCVLCHNGLFAGAREKDKKTSQKSPPNKSSASAAASTKTAAVIHGIPRNAHVAPNTDLLPPRNKASYEGNY